MNLLKQFIKLDLMCKGVMSILLSDEVLSPAVDLIPRPTLLLYEKEHIYIYIYCQQFDGTVYIIAKYRNFVNNSYSVIVRAGVESTNVICPRNGTYDLSIFAIFSKTGFVDIVPLCRKPPILSF